VDTVAPGHHLRMAGDYGGYARPLVDAWDEDQQ
jgi:hypothetical protein